MQSKPKPQKPTEDFPLFPHTCGKWAKKIKGKMIYFGRWEDPEYALSQYYDFISGKQAEPVFVGLTVANGCNLFLAFKDKAMQAGELSFRSFADYRRTAKRMIEYWGRDRSIESLVPHDFSLYKSAFSETNNPVSTGNEITRIKTIFKWLQKSNHCGDLDFGPDFRKPSAKVARGHRRRQGKKIFTRKQIHQLLDESGVHLRAMILLGINCGYGNNDCNTLPLDVARDAIETGWINYHRPKTEIERRCPLWKITILALQRSLARRPKSRRPNAFIKHNGREFSDTNNDIAKRFRIARASAYIANGGFYWLRHTFETIAGECKDQVAVNAIMGHVDMTMGAVYREEISDERLKNCVECVRRWFA